MLDHETQVRRLFARLAQRTDGAVLGAVVDAARNEGPAAYFVANALRSHETLDERAAVTVLADLPFEARVRFAAERASGPEAVAGLFDVEDFDEELGYTLDDLDDLDELSTIPEWLWVTFAELGGKDTVSRILRVCPSLAGRLLGRVAEFGRPDQLELLGRCPALTVAALTTGDGPLYDAALDVAMAGWAGEVTTEISVTQAQIDEWLRRRPFELVAAGEGRVVDAAAGHLFAVCAWRCVEAVTELADELAALGASHPGLGNLSVLVDRCRTDTDMPVGGLPFAELLAWAISEDPAGHERFADHMRTVCNGDDRRDADDIARHGYACWRFATNRAVGDDELTTVAAATRRSYLGHAYHHGLRERGRLAPATVAAASPWRRGRLGELLEVCTDPGEAARLALAGTGDARRGLLEGICGAGLWDDTWVPLLGCAEAMYAAVVEPDTPLSAAGGAVLCELVDIVDGDERRARLLLELFPTFPGTLAELRGALDAACA